MTNDDIDILQNMDRRMNPADTRALVLWQPPARVVAVLTAVEYLRAALRITLSWVGVRGQA